MAPGAGENDSWASVWGAVIRESGIWSGFSVWRVHERQDRAAEFVMEPCRRRNNKQLMMLADLLVFVSPWNTCYV